MNDASHVTWGVVRPKIESELEQIKSQLIVAPLSDVQALQAQAQALAKVKSWFESGAKRDSRIMDDSPSY